MDAVPGKRFTRYISETFTSKETMPFITLAAALAFTATPLQAPITSGDALIRAMHDRYAKTWYRSLSFVQRVVHADGKPEDEWWEAAKLPGRLRIDVAPVDSGTTFMYVGDSVFRFSKKTLSQSGPSTNYLLVLGFDVYAQPPEKTLEVLNKGHFDLSKLREDTWDGRRAYVVGDDKNQFWIDKERLIFLRLIQTGPSGAVSDIRFNKYQPLAGGWIAPEVVFVRDGKEFMREVYRDWKANNPLITDDLFSTPTWQRAGWVPTH